MGADAGVAGLMGPELQLLLPALDERARRLVLGAVARAAGEGGITAVARQAGASWQTVADGAAELDAAAQGTAELMAPGRVRRPGGGRKRLADTDPGLARALEALVDDSSRGDPESPLAWTTKSAARLSRELTAQGHRCSKDTAWRLLHELGFSTQANAKVLEGRRHPDRDAQFRHIAAQAAEHLAAGQPVISVDAKKKENVGNLAQGGREWARKGEPARVSDHSFAGPGGHAIPYGIYDVGAGTGFVNVGTDHNTAALAVESARRWWQLAGKDAYPGAARLLITCDAGGSNGYKNRAWKAGLAKLAQETGLEITVCHFPPGTSKWNKIEHRLFSQITLGWRGRPLTSYQVIINTISAVTTTTGLTVTAVLDTGAYPAGQQVSDQELKDIQDRWLTPAPFHGEWNYTLQPVPRPAPGPPPPPAPARRASQHTLNQPALTGMDPADLTALAAALEAPFRGYREQRRYQRLSHDRRAGHGGGHNRKLDLTDHILALRLREHLRLPPSLAGALLGVHATTISHATTRTAALLAGIPRPPAAPPPGTPLRTLTDLHAYTAAHGITLTMPGTASPPP